MDEETGQKPSVIDTLNAPIVRALDARGITVSYLARKLKAELNAKEVKTFYDKEKGIVVYSEPLVAWDIRQKARMDAHALRGDYPPERKEVSGKDGSPLQIIIHDMTKPRAKPGADREAEDPQDVLAEAEKDMIDG